MTRIILSVALALASDITLEDEEKVNIDNKKISVS